MVKNSGSDMGEAIAGIALGIIGGLALGALLDYLLGPKCPNCNQPIKKEMSRCPHCGRFLEWGFGQ